MNIEKLNLKLQYEKYMDPNFNWKNHRIYIYDENFNDPKFIDIFINKINWQLFCIYNHQLPNNLDLCEKYKSNIHWKTLSSYHLFSFEFCKKFYKKIDWYKYCEHNRLTIEMLFEFAPIFNNNAWIAISKYQKNLTQPFLDMYHHKISPKLLRNNQCIRGSLINYFIDKYGMDN